MERISFGATKFVVTRGRGHGCPGYELHQPIGVFHSSETEGTTCHDLEEPNPIDGINQGVRKRNGSHDCFSVLFSFSLPVVKRPEGIYNAPQTAILAPIDGGNHATDHMCDQGNEGYKFSLLISSTERLARKVCKTRDFHKGRTSGGSKLASCPSRFKVNFLLAFVVTS